MDKYTQGWRGSQVRRVRQCRRPMVEDQDPCRTKLQPKEKVEAARELATKAFVGMQPVLTQTNFFSNRSPIIPIRNEPQNIEQGMSIDEVTAPHKQSYQILASDAFLPS